MRVIIAGGRELEDPALLEAAIRASGFEITVVVNGGARGIDALARAWARKRGIPLEVYAPDWSALGRRAGPFRNARMADAAEACIAIPGLGRGTYDMIRRARARRLKLYIHPQGTQVASAEE